jgi:fatty acid desaturase
MDEFGRNPEKATGQEKYDDSELLHYTETPKEKRKQREKPNCGKNPTTWTIFPYLRRPEPSELMEERGRMKRKKESPFFRVAPRDSTT